MDHEVHNDGIFPWIFGKTLHVAEFFPPNFTWLYLSLRAVRTADNKIPREVSFPFPNFPH